MTKFILSITSLLFDLALIADDSLQSFLRQNQKFIQTSEKVQIIESYKFSNLLATNAGYKVIQLDDIFHLLFALQNIQTPHNKYLH